MTEGESGAYEGGRSWTVLSGNGSHELMHLVFEQGQTSLYWQIRERTRWSAPEYLR